MVKHIILWTLRDGIAPAERDEILHNIKEGLEGLKGRIPGLVDIHVQTAGRLATSNADLMLDSTLESPEALAAYAAHPLHVAVAAQQVKPHTVQRVCLDFEV